MLFTKSLFLIFLFSVIFSIIQYNVGVFLIFEIVLLTAFLLRSTRKIASAEDSRIDYPFVSIIIPMRNEEKNVKECLQSLYALNYPNFEIIIGDDSSTDNTRKLLMSEAREYSGVTSATIVDIPPMPASWAGKAWAVYQLTYKAKGEVLLVTDADVRHTPQSLRNSVSHFLKTKADMMIRFPYPIIKSTGEWPIAFLFFVLRFSMWFSMKCLKQRQALAKEEYVMFSRRCYDTVGGYEAFKNDYPMITAMLRAVFRANMNVVIVDDDSKEITTRMYEGFRRTTSGITERINFRHIRFYSFLGAFTAIYFATDGIFRIISSGFVNSTSIFLSGLVSYLIFNIFFGIYLFYSRQPLIITPFAPFLGFHMILMSIFAMFRLIIHSPLYWKGRILYIQ